MGEKEHNNISLSSQVDNDVVAKHVHEDEWEYILTPRAGRINDNNYNGIKYRNRTNKISVSKNYDDNNDSSAGSSSSSSFSSRKKSMYKQSLFLVLLLVSVGAIFVINNNNKSRSSDNSVGINPIQIQSGVNSIVGNSKSKDLLVHSSDESTNSSMIDTTTTIPNCIIDDGPTPVILMTMGRSGSTGIWQALGKLTGYDSFNEKKAKLEYVGEDQQQQQKFFLDKQNGHKKEKEKNGKWLLNYMCELRHTTFKDATFVGFKWKSWLKFLLTEEGRKTLQLIASLANEEEEIPALYDSSTSTISSSSSTGSVAATAKQRQRTQRSPPIRIIRSRRNPIDVELSFYKHRLYTRNKKKETGGAVKYLPAHCNENNKDCLQKHYTMGENQTIQNLDQFFKDTYQRWDEENKVDSLLLEMNVPVIFLSYDTLYYPSSKEKCGDGENEWNKALNFVRGGGVGINNNSSNGSSSNNNKTKTEICVENNNIDNEYYKSWTQIQDAMGYVSTTRTRNHKELISNWFEIERKFMGTPLEQFLRLS